jgi:hypothetical protein
MKILLLTPPLTQLNMAYPATAQLTGFLKTRHIEVAQADLGIELIETLFKKENIRKIFELAGEQKLSKRAQNHSEQCRFLHTQCRTNHCFPFGTRSYSCTSLQPTRFLACGR